MSLLKRYVRGVLLAGALWTSSAVYAASTDQVINGATCIPYPPLGDAGVAAVPYQHWLYGFGKQAFCHLTMSDEWTVNDLSYVLFSGITNAGELKARLCVHAGEFAVSCGAEKTISGTSISINWVTKPSVMPPYATGAFVQITFPSGTVSTINQLIPVWTR